MAAWREEPPKSGRWRKQIWHLGRPITLTFAGTKGEADLYEAKRRIELGAVETVSSGSVLDYETYCADRYKPHAKATLRSSTWGVRKFQLENLLLHFGRVKLPKLNEPEIEAYKMKRLSEHADKVTINTELNVLSATLTYARDTLKIQCASPKIKRFKITKKKGRVQFFTRDEVARILDATKEQFKNVYPLIVFLFETGCRKSEAINLPWSKVLFDQKIVRIWNDEESGYEVKSVEREIPISDHLMVILKTQKLRGLSKEWVFPVTIGTKGGKGSKGRKLVEFPDNTWTRILAYANEMAAETAKKTRTKAPPTLSGGPHKARHTFASHFLQSKPDIFLLGRVLGHSHTRVTELYSHLLPEHMAEARNVVSFGPSGTASGPHEGGSRPARKAGSGRETHSTPTLVRYRKATKRL